MKVQLAVIFGGNSVEHEVSIITAIQAMENINYEKYDVLPIYISKENKWYHDDSFFSIDSFKENLAINDNKEILLDKIGNDFYIINKKKGLFKNKSAKKIDVVFPIVHGTNVEDGKLQGYLQTIGIPLIGPTTTSGVIGQDKAIMKDILKGNNILQTNYIWAYASEKIDDIIKRVINTIGKKVIVKPAELGSSIGIKIANNEEEIKIAIENAFEYTNKIVIEELLEEFIEINVSVVGNFKGCEVSVTEQVAKNDEILSYEDKYMSGNKKSTNQNGMASLKRIIPANVDKKVISEINEISQEVFKILNCNGVIRIDLMLINNQIYVNEINNIPGSLAFYLWEASGKTYQELLELIIDLGIETFYINEKKTYSIESNILNNIGGKIK